MKAAIDKMPIKFNKSDDNIKQEYKTWLWWVYSVMHGCFCQIRALWALCSLSAQQTTTEQRACCDLSNTPTLHQVFLARCQSLLPLLPTLNRSDPRVKTRDSSCNVARLWDWMFTECQHFRVVYGAVWASRGDIFHVISSLKCETFLSFEAIMGPRYSRMATQAKPKCCCFHRPVNSVLLTSLFAPWGAVMRKY